MFFLVFLLQEKNVECVEEWGEFISLKWILYSNYESFFQLSNSNHNQHRKMYVKNNIKQL